MTAVALISLAFVGGIAVMVLKALAVGEAKGRIERCITRHLDATIAALPDDTRVEWAEEWRADLASIITMPLTATQFVREVRRSVAQLTREPLAEPPDVSASTSRSTFSPSPQVLLGTVRLQSPAPAPVLVANGIPLLRVSDQLFRTAHLVKAFDGRPAHFVWDRELVADSRQSSYLGHAG